MVLDALSLTASNRHATVTKLLANIFFGSIEDCDVISFKECADAQPAARKKYVSSKNYPLKGFAFGDFARYRACSVR